MDHSVYRESHRGELKVLIGEIDLPGASVVTER